MHRNSPTREITLDQKRIVRPHDDIKSPRIERGCRNRDWRGSCRRRLRRRTSGKVERQNIDIFEKAAVRNSNDSTNLSARQRAANRQIKIRAYNDSITPREKNLVAL